VSVLGPGLFMPCGLSGAAVVSSRIYSMQMQSKLISFRNTFPSVHYTPMQQSTLFANRKLCCTSRNQAVNSWDMPGLYPTTAYISALIVFSCFGMANISA
jgi:hypothetical protein